MTERKRRKLKLNEEAEESVESMYGTPVQLEYVEEPRDEDMKDEEEGEKEVEKIEHDISQIIKDPNPNLGTQIHKGPRMKRTNVEYVGPSMGYAEDT
ncbi:hypothetical protein KI387_011111, partial [Taxus chinensis]